MRTISSISRIILAATVLFVTACSKDDEPAPDYNSDKTRLKQVIDSLTNVYNTTAEGNKPGQYVIGARKALDSVLSLSGQVYTGQYTQQQVNNAVANLLTAGQTFNSKLLQRPQMAEYYRYLLPTALAGPAWHTTSTMAQP
jgi:hypothetical protein